MMDPQVLFSFRRQHRRLRSVLILHRDPVSVSSQGLCQEVQPVWGTETPLTPLHVPEPLRLQSKKKNYKYTIASYFDHYAKCVIWQGNVTSVFIHQCDTLSSSFTHLLYPMLLLLFFSFKLY